MNLGGTNEGHHLSPFTSGIDAHSTNKKSGGNDNAKAPVEVPPSPLPSRHSSSSDSIKDPAQTNPNNEKAHSSPVSSKNSSTTSSLAIGNNTYFLLPEPVILEPFIHQVGGHSSVLRFDSTTLCKPLIPREKKFYESKIPVDLKPFIPQFRGILEVKIVDEQDGFISLEGQKIFGLPDVLEYHRTQSLNNSQSKSSHRKWQRPMTSNHNGENQEVPPRFRLRRSGSIEIPTTKSSCDDKGTKEGAKDNKSLPPDSKSPMSKAKLSLTAPKDLGLSVNPASSSHGMAMINPWNVQMVKAELRKMRKKDSNKFLLQENAVHSFRCPTVIDLKMGIRQHGDDASEEKKTRFIEKSKKSTSSKLGVRLCGLQVYQANTNKYVYVDKYYGRIFSVDGFKKIVFLFLYNGVEVRLDLIDTILSRLRQLHDVVSGLSSFRFFSSSLLIGYDGSSALAAEPHASSTSTISEQMSDHDLAPSAHPPLDTSGKDASEMALLAAPARSALSPSSVVNASPAGSASAQACRPHRAVVAEKPSPLAPLIDMKMIDFAHTTHREFADEIKYDGPDDGYLLGLRTMMDIFEEIRCMSPTETQAVIDSLNSLDANSLRP